MPQFVRKSEADIIAEQSELIAIELSNENASLFSVAEISYVNEFLTKTRWGTSIDQEKRYLDNLTKIKQYVRERKNLKG